MAKASTALLAAAVAALIWTASDVFLLGFAGVLLAAFLRGLSDPLSRVCKIPDRVSLALVLLILVAVGGVGSALLAPRIAGQIDELTEKISQSLDKLEETLSDYEWAQQLLSRTTDRADDVLLRRGDDILARLTGIVSSTFGAMTGVLVSLVIGLYLALDPRLYTSGIIRLVPPSKRELATKTFSHIGSILRWWLLGKVVSMVTVGILTGIGLWLLGVPLALSLAAIAGALAFVPNLGPVLSLIPAALLALTVRPILALYVVLLFGAIQAFETYLLTPFIQEKTIKLPPALTVFMQVLFGILFGGLGLVLAAPFTGVLLGTVTSLSGREAGPEEGTETTT